VATEPEPPAPDLAAIDVLCRLVLAASRLGCRVHLVDVDPRLHDLLVLAGVDSSLLEKPKRTDLA